MGPRSICSLGVDLCLPIVFSSLVSSEISDIAFESFWLFIFIVFLLIFLKYIGIFYEKYSFLKNETILLLSSITNQIFLKKIIEVTIILKKK